MIIAVYKTDVNTELKLRKAQRILKKTLAGCRWNFDLEVCDNILRVESEKNGSDILISHLHKIGICCEELF